MKENPIDFENQQRILRTVARSRNYTVIDTPVAYPMDALFELNGRTVALAEARKRNIPMSKNKTFMWSLQKYISATNYSFILPTYLFVEWSEGGIYWIQIRHKKYEVSYMGHTDRGDPRDMEPCVLIPHTEFTLFVDNT